MNIKDYKIIFWDFDGVIKESVNIKTDAFVELFYDYGSSVIDKIIKHHTSNGGMSRFKKIPIYANYAGLNLSEIEIEKYANKFSEIVVSKVVNSKWVPGIEKVLQNKPINQKFILVSATPDDELKYILKCLNIDKTFDFIYGSNINKSDAIYSSISFLKMHNSDCIMFGDALADLEAAQKNNIEFILRQHDTNTDMNFIHNGIKILNFLNYESIRINF